MITIHCPTCNRTVLAKRRPNTDIDGLVECPACEGLLSTDPGRGPVTPAYAGEPTLSGMAVSALISGILGLSFVPCLGSLAGLLCGWLALSEIAESEKNVNDGLLTGRGLAVAGLVLSAVGLLLWGALFLFLVVLARA